MILQYDFTIFAKVHAWETLKKIKDSLGVGSVWILNMQMNIVDLWKESYMCNTKKEKKPWTAVHLVIFISICMSIYFY